MALDSFIPSAFSGSVLKALKTDLVYGQPNVATTEYNGLIQRQGDRVKVASVGDVTISNYTRNTNIAAAETLTSAQLEVLIDQAKYFNFQEDQLDQIQTNTDVFAEAADRASYNLAKAADSFMAGLYSDISSTNTYGTDASPITITASNAYQYLVKLRTALDKTDTPKDGRWVIVPPDYIEMLLQDDKFVKSGTAPSDTRLVNGRVFSAAGFDIIESNQVVNTSSAKYKVIAGHRNSWTFCAQFMGTEIYSPELRVLAKAMKGLYLYGGKVLRPSNMALVVASF